MDQSLIMKNVYKKIKDEGDEKFFSYLDYPCAILRPAHERLHLCGYVGVTKDHPIYKLAPYIVAFEDYFHVHGGLNYYKFDLPGKPVGEKPSEEYWYFGFSCTHKGDIVPFDKKFLEKVDAKFLNPTINYGDTYKDMAFVEKEVRKLARQLKLIEVESEIRLVLFEV